MHASVLPPRWAASSSELLWGAKHCSHGLYIYICQNRRASWHVGLDIMSSAVRYRQTSIIRFSKNLCICFSRIELRVCMWPVWLLAFLHTAFVYISYRYRYRIRSAASWGWYGVSHPITLLVINRNESPVETTHAVTGCVLVERRKAKKLHLLAM